MEREVSYQVEGLAARLTICREPARNALSPAVIASLREGVERASQDSAVRVIVLTGEGSKTFCAGADLSSLAGDGALAAHAARGEFAALLMALQSSPKPTLARVNGQALAGGLGLVLACDLAVASSSATFGTPEIDRGLFPMMVTALLQRHLGRKRALEVVLSGDRFSAQQALEWGLVNRVADPAALDATVHSLAQRVGEHSLATLELGRRAFYTAEDLPLAPALEFLNAQLSLNVLSDDAAEGVSAFLEKRAPKWVDR